MDIKITRGVDINLKGKAETALKTIDTGSLFSIKPTDFKMMYPKLMVREGDEVLAGQGIIYSKDNENIFIPSPVSGEVVEIIRGDKRKLLEIRILADKETRYKNVGSVDVKSLTKESTTKILLDSGLWSLIRQRPYGIIANPEHTPKAIFISAFDSSPLAPEVEFCLKGEEKNLHAGIEAMKKLTSGKVHVSFRKEQLGASVFQGITNIEKHTVSGPHPAGNVGVQIHHVDPINKGELVWTVTPQDLAIIGRLINDGKVNLEKKVAITGPEAKNPTYYSMKPGQQIESIVNEQATDVAHTRVVSGNVLTGTVIGAKGSLGFYDNQITLLQEDHEPEMFGWIKPGFDKFTIHKALLKLFGNGKDQNYSTKMHGELRAFVVTGEYEKVFPFDIYPVQLLKAVMMNDIDKMEQLGIYEVIEEDMALCEVVCTSKIPVQETLYEGLELMKQELG